MPLGATVINEADDARGNLLEQPALVNRYYVVTQLYEYACGQLFQFSSHRTGESLRRS